MALFDTSILKSIKENPDKLFELTPRQFEELIAELVASFGWSVSLTPQSRDGGYDILGVSKDISGLETDWIIECKAGKPVGLNDVRSLYGVQRSLNVPQALFVTTSKFTRDARDFANRNSIKIVDNARVLEWISQYRPRPDRSSYAAANRFQSCFLSYSHKDEAFATQLVERLRAEGVKVWFAPEDLSPGQKIYEKVSEAIENFDRLLLVISENSMNSPWVQTEVRRAHARELRDRRRVLFPISIVNFETLRKWQLFDADSGRDLAVEIREYLIPNFSDWELGDAFETQAKNLLKGLADD